MKNNHQNIILIYLIDNQVLLHSTLDLIQSQKDNRSNQSNLSEKSNSHRRMDKNIRLYHLVRAANLSTNIDLEMFCSIVF